MSKNTLISRPGSNLDRLAYWYFRLNGFMSIENFYVHPENRGSARTDADVIATRFQHRREDYYPVPMSDDPSVVECDTFVNIVIAETTRNECKLNGPWTKPERSNMQRVLNAIGCVHANEVDGAARSLYESGKWTNELTTIRLFALGENKNENFPNAYIPIKIDPKQQIDWNHIIDFCIQRLNDYESQKADVSHWANDGKMLKTLARQNARNDIRTYFNLRTESDIARSIEATK